jgi:hypothetical protein
VRGEDKAEAGWFASFAEERGMTVGNYNKKRPLVQQKYVAGASVSSYRKRLKGNYCLPALAVVRVRGLVSQKTVLALSKASVDPVTVNCDLSHCAFFRWGLKWVRQQSSDHCLHEHASPGEN